MSASLKFESNNVTTTPNYDTTSSIDDHESFKNFFEAWLGEQDQYLHQLNSSIENNTDAEALKGLVSRVMEHYTYYYQTKSKWAKLSVLSTFAPCWTSKLEDSIMWIGGWLPSMCFNLLYSKTGLQFESRLPEILRGFTTNDLGDLSASQFGLVDKLQKRTVFEERKLNDKMAKLQNSMADASMVELSHTATQLLKIGSDADSGSSNSKAEEDERPGTVMKLKEEGLEELLRKADDLRLRTLKETVEILSPIQAVHFLIAAAELHLRLRDWGKTMDAQA